MSEDEPKLMVLDLDGTTVLKPGQVSEEAMKELLAQGQVGSLNFFSRIFPGRIFNLVRKLRLFNFGRSSGEIKSTVRDGLMKKHSEYVAGWLKDKKGKYITLEESESILNRASERIEIAPGIKELVEEARKKGWEVRLLTGQPQQTAEAFGRRLRLNEKHCYGTKFEVTEDGRLTGELEQVMDSKEKASILKELMEKGHVPHVIVDDSFTGIRPMVEEALKYLNEKYGKEKRLSVIKVGPIGFMPKEYEGKNIDLIRINKPSREKFLRAVKTIEHRAL